jgi:hypothetical protein
MSPKMQCSVAFLFDASRLAIARPFSAIVTIFSGVNSRALKTGKSVNILLDLRLVYDFDRYFCPTGLRVKLVELSMIAF